MNRILKVLAISSTMYFSLRFLGVSTGPAIIMSLIPAVLGTLNIMIEFAYGLTALVFILACVSALMPELKNDLYMAHRVISALLTKWAKA